MRAESLYLKIASTLLPLFFISGCGGGGDSSDNNSSPSIGAHKTMLTSTADYTALQGSRSELKFILPIASRNPPEALTADCYFQNTQTYPLHLEFLRSVSDLEEMSNTRYESMTLSAEHSLWSGELRGNTSVEHPQTGETGTYLYILATDESADSLQATAEEIIAVDQTLKACMPWVASKLVYIPTSSIQSQRLNTISTQLTAGGVAWLQSGDAGGGSTAPTAYSKGEYYGYLKWFDVGETPEDVGPFDVVVSEHASNNLGLLAGIVTQLPQTYLSHLNLRLREKNIPSAQLPGVLDNTTLKALDGKLVHIVVSDDSVDINRALLSDAEAFWADRHPNIGQLTFDLSQQAMLSFSELRHNKSTAYGGKASNLGELYEALGADDAVHGFGIPTFWYDQFMQNSGLAASVNTLLNDERIYTDAGYRKDQLKALRTAIRQQPLPTDFMQRLRTSLAATLGANVATTRIRFRSSTNAEDLRAFSGAGLYDSKSGCLADLDDADDVGPSRCLSATEKSALETELAARRQEFTDHPERTWLEEMISDIEKDLTKEKPLDAAVLKVWASLWTLRAFDEREYYQLDHRKAFMGIAVNKSFVMERREAVVITNESSVDASDNRTLYRVNSQLGSTGVVRPDDPSAVAEEMTFRQSTTTPAQAEDIRVVTRSSLSPDADLWSSDQKQALATRLFKAHKHFTEHVYNDLSNPAFDVEVEVLSDAAGNDIIYLKQLRPYLSADSEGGGSTVGSCPAADSYIGDNSWPVTAVVSENVALCHYPSWSSEVDFAAIRAKKDRIKLTAGTYKLPNASTNATLSIPMCLSDDSTPTGTGAPSVVSAGFSLDLPEASTTVNSFYQAGSQGLLLRVNFPQNETQLNFGTVAADYPQGLSADYPASGVDDASRLGNYRQCQFSANAKYQVEVQNVGSLLIESHRWAGTAGAGFAAPVRVSGTWRGQAIDISHYDQMTIAYERHAFAASLHLMFDQPIAGEYGVSIQPFYNSTGNDLVNSDIEAASLDASGNLMIRLSGVTSTKQE